LLFVEGGSDNILKKQNELLFFKNIRYALEGIKNRLKRIIDDLENKDYKRKENMTVFFFNAIKESKDGYSLKGTVLPFYELRSKPYENEVKPKKIEPDFFDLSEIPRSPIFGEYREVINFYNCGTMRRSITLAFYQQTNRLDFLQMQRIGNIYSHSFSEFSVKTPDRCNTTISDTIEKEMSKRTPEIISKRDDNIAYQVHFDPPLIKKENDESFELLEIYEEYSFNYTDDNHFFVTIPINYSFKLLSVLIELPDIFLPHYEFNKEFLWEGVSVISETDIAKNENRIDNFNIETEMYFEKPNYVLSFSAVNPPIHSVLKLSWKMNVPDSLKKGG
jgi:hypothetical protein